MTLKKTNIFLLIAAIAVILTSCTSTVTVSYMKPGRVNMGPYRNLAVASTVDASSLGNPPFFIRTRDEVSYKEYGDAFSTWSSLLSSSAADYSTNMLEQKLRESGFFTVTGHKVTDSILAREVRGSSRKEMFSKAGIDAVIIPRIDSMNVNEWIRSITRETKVKLPDGTEEIKNVPVYFWEYELRLAWSYTVIDAATERIVARNVFDRTYSDSVEISGRLFNSTGFRNEFSAMVKNAVEAAVSDLISFSVSLMKDKSGIADAERAYELLEDGRYLDAVELLLCVWRDWRSVPAGYNAALLIGGTGNFDRAIGLLEEVIRGGGGSDAAYLKEKFEEARRSNSETEKFLSGDNIPGLSGPDIYDILGK